MLVGVSTAQVVSWGILYYAFSVFVAPMQAELGWSTVELTGAYSLALLCGGLAAMPVGRWLDQRGPRVLMSVGSTLAALLVLAWSQVRNLPAFYALMAGIGLVSAAVLYEPAFAVVGATASYWVGLAVALQVDFVRFVVHTSHFCWNELSLHGAGGPGKSAAFPASHQAPEGR